MMIEIENIERFPLSKKISAFFGLHPVFKESGDKGSGYRMSKKGRKVPRGILYMVTLSAIQRNPIIKEIYEERTSKGMVKMAAIGLCMHKLLRIMYGMLKNNTKFEYPIQILW
jgi:transposase